MNFFNLFVCVYIFVCLFYMSVGTHSCLYICGHPILISRGIPILGGGLPIKPRGCKYSSLPSQVVLLILFPLSEVEITGVLQHLHGNSSVVGIRTPALPAVEKCFKHKDSPQPLYCFI